MADRNLLPRSVYLEPATLDLAQARADALGVSLATYLRLVITGKQPPVDTADIAGVTPRKSSRARPIRRE